MSYFQCRKCEALVRVWNAELMERLPEQARASPDAAFVWGDRVFSCPSCSTSYRMPLGSVYVIFNKAAGRVQLRRAVARCGTPNRLVEAARRAVRGIGLRSACRFSPSGGVPDVAWLATGIGWVRAAYE